MLYDCFRKAAHERAHNEIKCHSTQVKVNGLLGRVALVIRTEIFTAICSKILHRCDRASNPASKKLIAIVLFYLRGVCKFMKWELFYFS